MLLSEQIIDLVDGEILGLGQREQGEGEAGQHHAAVEVEGAGQVEARLQQREHLEGDHHQQAGQGPGHALGQQDVIMLCHVNTAPCRKL